MRTATQIDNFMIIKLLGTGFTGEVYLVREASSGDLFALKVLKTQFQDNLSFL